MGVRLRLAGRTEVLSSIRSGERLRIATPNPEFILEARRNAAFREALESSLCIADGFGLELGLRLWRLRDRSFLPVSRYAGADLVEDLLADGGRSLYLLGGAPGVAEAAAARWNERYPGLRIVGAEDGGRVSDDPSVDPTLVARVNAARPDVLLVAFGMPKQELWMARAGGLEVPVMVGVGGTFDFYVRKKRAPRIWRRLRLEWLWRGLSEKGHWRRIWRATAVYGVTLLWTLLLS